MANEGRLEVISTIGTTEPVTLDEAKLEVGITVSTAEDDLIRRKVRAARIKAEQFLNKSILSRQYRQTEVYTNGIIRLLKSPVASVDRITIDGGDPLVEDVGYALRGAVNDPEIWLTDEVGRNDQPLAGFDNVVITFTTQTLVNPDGTEVNGFSTDMIKEGVLSIFSDLYNIGTITKNYRSILAPYKKLFI